jgi:hypothetical protein
MHELVYTSLIRLQSNLIKDVEMKEVAIEELKFYMIRNAKVQQVRIAQLQ